MEIRRLAGPLTPQNDCPAIYESDRGTFLIQGYRIPTEYRGRVSYLKDNEDVVEVPTSLIKLIKEL